MLTGQLLTAMMDVSDEYGKGAHMKLTSGKSGERREESGRMESEMVVAGAIIDSWIEPTQAEADTTRLVLQVARANGQRIW